MERGRSGGVESRGCAGWLRDWGARGVERVWLEVEREIMRGWKGGRVAGSEEANDGSMTIQACCTPVKQSWINTCKGRLAVMKCFVYACMETLLLFESLGYTKCSNYSWLFNKIQLTSKWVLAENNKTVHGWSHDYDPIAGRRQGPDTGPVLVLEAEEHWLYLTSWLSGPSPFAFQIGSTHRFQEW